MIQDDFFEVVEVDVGWGTQTKKKLRTDVVQAAWHHALKESDLEVARPLMGIVRNEFTKHGTGGNWLLADEELSLSRRALQAVSRRLGYSLEIPFTNGESFHDYWKRHGAVNSYQARRDILAEIFDPLEKFIEELEDRQIDGALAHPVSPRGRTGWQQVDQEVRELRVKFSSARTEADYSDVGNRSVRVIELLSQVVYDSERHARLGDPESGLPVSSTKDRLERFVEFELPGSGNAELRSFVRKAVAVSHSVKHSPAPSRRNAGIVADTSIMLANLLRRIADF